MKSIVILLSIATMGFAQARTALKLKEQSPLARKAERIQTSKQSANDSARTQDKAGVIHQVAPFTGQAAKTVRSVALQNTKNWEGQAQQNHGQFMQIVEATLSSGKTPATALNTALMQFSQNNATKAQELKEEIAEKCRI